MEQLKNIDFSNVELTSGFWKKRWELNADVSVEAVRKHFEKDHFEGMRFKYKKNDPKSVKPHIYFDSSNAKWIEAVSYLLQKDRKRFARYEKECDELIDCLARNQREDGYINSYFLQVEPEAVFTRRTDHELYCAGHLIEAAVAYDKATGKHKFLKVIERFCDCINRIFIQEKSAKFVTPGHEEIELALVKLYEYTGKCIYLDMARFFLDMRGNNDKDIYYNFANDRYAQDNAPVRKLRSAEGHAVRAVYLYCGMADVARLTGDKEMFTACKYLYDDICKKMYVTGGIGSARMGETFTVPYDLPNITAYSESCAAIGLMFFCQRMLKVECDSKYADTIERILYNGFLSSVSLDGKKFFYENPLEVCEIERGKETSIREDLRIKLPPAQRSEMFECACCPPNINRFMASLGGAIWMIKSEEWILNQFISSKTNFNGVNVEVKTNYPVEGDIDVYVKNYKGKRFAFRVPSWAKKPMVYLNEEEINYYIIKNGYCYIDTQSAQFKLHIEFDVRPYFLESHPFVRENAGRICLTAGPVVYCLEEKDNGAALNALSVKTNAVFYSKFDFVYGMNIYFCEGYRKIAKRDEAFGDHIYKKEKVRLKWIPYFAFGNRGKSDMLVWVSRN